MQVCKQSGCKRRRARVSAARRAAHLHSALLLPSSAARPPRWQRQLVWDVRHAASCATSSIFSRSAICYLFPRCSRRGYRFKHTYVTDAGVADWRHDMENRAYRRDRRWIGSLKTWGSCPWSDSQLRPRRGPTALRIWAGLSPASVEVCGARARPVPTNSACQYMDASHI